MQQTFHSSIFSILWSSFTLLYSCCLRADSLPSENLQYTNHVYRSFIKTVTLHAAANPLSYPIAPLQGGVLSLGFDDLRPNPCYYQYQLIHCNAQWQASNLSTFDYLNGFSQDQISNFSFSSGTQIPYIHYQLDIPNQAMQPKKSGNYLLVVYEDSLERPVLTRRLMFYENVAHLEAHWFSGGGMQNNTHQRLSCQVDFSDKDLNNPMEQIKLCVLQNGRWDNAQMLSSPTFWDFQSLRYDSYNSLLFAADNDFRFIDCRLTNPRGRNKRKKNAPTAATEEAALPTVLVQNDQVRNRSAQRFRITNRDYNGKFLIGGRSSLWQWNDADYTLVRFRLDATQLPEHARVYLYGGLSDWQVSPDFALSYNAHTQVYETTLYLKQGIYDYQYLAFLPDQIDLSPHQLTEGDFVTTENDYLLLVYYHTFTQSYDRLIGYQLLNTNQ